MNTSTRNLFNWILIGLLVLLPLRGVMAYDKSDCQMQDQAKDGAAVEMASHSMHAMHMPSDDAQVDVTYESQDCCCCDSGMNCNGDCDFGISASFIMQSIVAVPALNNTAIRIHSRNNLISRELIPPTRPPASLHS